MSVTFVKALVALVPDCMLLSGATIMFSRRKSLSSLLQVLGAGFLIVVALTHVCEALHLFPRMNWGLEQSTGHYLDGLSAVLGLTFFPAGYLLHALASRPRQISSFAVPAKRP